MNMELDDVDNAASEAFGVLVDAMRNAKRTETRVKAAAALLDAWFRERSRHEAPLAAE